ncbi:hypothetical protein [Terasakiella sp.]|uniref:hypothetical protein n=1 Tax=Terasakiella sp. TaxID=2034861 RepID=UPI003AA81B92
MPQRAILDGDVSVFAFDTTDDGQWAGLTAAYKADKLLLPCCHTSAIPKENTRGTRYFSHKPHRRKECDWKLVGEQHEEVLVAIAEEVKRRGWRITTEFKTDQCRADILLEHSTYKLKIAFQIELKSREIEDILNEQEALHTADITVHHIFSHRRNPVHREIINPAYVATGKQANTVSEVQAVVRRLLDGIDRRFLNLKEATRILDNSGKSYDITYDNGIPSFIMVEDDPPFKINIRKNVDISIPDRLPANDKERIAYQQKEFANMFQDRLQHGIKLYWDGHPRLRADSFDRLKNKIRSTTKQPKEAEVFSASSPHSRSANWRQDFRPSSQSISMTASPQPNTVKKGARPSDIPIRPLINLSVPNPYYDRIASNEIPEPPEFNDWGEIRANEVRTAAQKAMHQDDADIWLNTPNKALRGLTPLEAANWDSEGVTECVKLLTTEGSQ